MRTIETKIYRFDELSDEAKQRAKDDYAADCGYCWADDEMASIKALAEHFGGKMSNWEIDWFNCSHSSARFDMPELSKREIAELLKELGTYSRRTMRGNGECKLTGYCGDENAIDGFRIAFKRGKVVDLVELMQAAFDTWLKGAQSDCECQYSDEAFGEHCEANGYEFDEDGKFAR